MNTAAHDSTTPRTSQVGLGASHAEILRQLAGFVATALPEAWRVAVPAAGEAGDPGAVFLDGPDNACLRICLQRPDRVKVTGMYPRHHLPHGVTYYDITVARDRGPAVLGQAIISRLLVKYLPELARVQAATLVQAGQVETRQALTQQLLTTLAQHGMAGEPGQNGRVWVRSESGPYGHADIDVTGQHAVVYLSFVPAPLLLAIAELIVTNTSPPQ